jgi:hypothetical protein
LDIDIEKLKDLPRKSSKDYLELLHIALEMNDKEWFEELATEKERLEQLEKYIKSQ